MREEKKYQYYDTIENKSKQLLSKSNIFYQLSILLLNALVLILVWVWQSNKLGTVTIEDFLKSLDLRFLWLALVLFVLEMILVAFTNYFNLYKKHKQKRFVVMLKNYVCGRYCMCVAWKTADKELSSVALVESGVNSTMAMESVYGSSFLTKIGSLLFSIVSIIVGSMWFLECKLVLFVLALVVITFELLFIVLVLLFEKHKVSIVKNIAKLSKVLFKLKLIRNYELFYRNAVEKLNIYSNSLKLEKITIVSHLFVGVFLQFLKCIMLYLILCLINFGYSGAFVEVLFLYSLFDMLLKHLPYKGVLFYEVLFISLFKDLFFEGYLLWGMVVYRVLDYFIWSIVYFLFFAFLKLGKAVARKKTL